MLHLPLLNWLEITHSLSQKGYAIIPQVLSRQECGFFRNNYSAEGIYRATINMQRYRFGKGEYKYFSYPLPELVQRIRTELYASLAPLANEWMQLLGLPDTFPVVHPEFIEQCKKWNQVRPTPLILRYHPGGHNTLHQDVYGAIWFPFQVVIPLTQFGRDHTGGELVLIEQVPRAQSKAVVLQVDQGDGVIFATNFRPATGARGYYRAHMKHGVSEIRSGERYALGIIFHDSE